jgi:hypothetical protein
MNDQFRQINDSALNMSQWYEVNQPLTREDSQIFIEQLAQLNAFGDSLLFQGVHNG